MSHDFFKNVEIPTLPLNKTQRRLYPASSDPTFEHETYQDMENYLNNKTSYFGQIIYCKDTDKHYSIARGEGDTKILKETTITTSENINYSNSSLSDVTNVKSALDIVLTKSNENAEAIGTINESVDSVKTSLDDVLNKSNENAEAIGTINESVTNVKTDTTNIKTQISDIEKLLLSKFPTTYTDPTINVSSKNGSVFELGSNITPIITATFTKNDAGNIVKYKLLKNGQQIHESSSVQEFTDTQFELNSSVEYTAEVEYGEGEVKKDSLGRPSSNGQIQAGTIRKSIRISTARASWGFVTDSADAPTPESIRRNTTPSVNLRKGSTIKAIATTTTRTVIFAYPAELKECAKIRYEELGDDGNKTSFTKTTMQIPDKSGKNAIEYMVYYYTPLVAFGATATFILTI